MKIEEAGMLFDESVETPSFLGIRRMDTEILDLFVQQEIVYIMVLKTWPWQPGLGYQAQIINSC